MLTLMRAAMSHLASLGKLFCIVSLSARFSLSLGKRFLLRDQNAGVVTYN